MVKGDPPIGSLQDVNVTNEEPIAVAIDDREPVRVSDANQRLAGAKVETDSRLAVAKVDADILKTEDQRRISGMWERTQQLVALSVVWDVLVVAAVLTVLPGFIALSGREVPEWAITASVAGLLFLTGAANLVIGFYFGRTNHQRVGGAGADPVETR